MSQGQVIRIYETRPREGPDEVRAYLQAQRASSTPEEYQRVLWNALFHLMQQRGNEEAIKAVLAERPLLNYREAAQSTPLGIALSRPYALNYAQLLYTAGGRLDPREYKNLKQMSAIGEPSKFSRTWSWGQALTNG